MDANQNPKLTVDPDGIAWITFDDPNRPLNVLDEDVMSGLRDRIASALSAGREGKARVLVVRSGKPDSFMAGADVEAIAAIEDPTVAEEAIRQGQTIYDELDALPFPTVAAIHGVCAGGGVEMALACDHRVLSDASKTKLMLPEVQLGILPAWGGTTRLPRLVGLEAALDMLLTGRRVDSRKARRIGLADQVVPGELFEEEVRAFALRAANGKAEPAGPKGRRLARMLGGTPVGRAVILRTARKRVLKTTGGHYPAPLRILDLLQKHLKGPVQESLAAEARMAAELVVSPVSKNLIHVFFMREAARKAKILPDGAKPKPVTSLGVLGAGVMGGGIAQLAAYNGISVYLKDIDHAAVTGGLTHARKLFDRAVKRRRMTKREARQAMERVAGGLDLHGLAGADLVVEAIVERMDVKRTVLAETERVVREDAVLATNTSSLSVDGMATALDRPERFCGMHFFNPVHKMPLVEVIRGSATSDEAAALVYHLALTMGKVPVIVGDGPGFLVNRILGPYLNEAGFLLGDGGRIDRIDGGATAFGMPMGPLRLIDEVGIDVSGHAGASLHEGLGDRLAPAPVLTALAGTGRLGRKGGSGFYRYEDDKEKGVDEAIYVELQAALPPPREIPEEEIRDRLVLAMINEAARILADGIAASAADVDLAMIMGTGFPPFRGGLLRFADTIHSRGILDRTRELAEQCGDRFQPAPLLERLAKEDRSFYDAFPGAGR